MSETTLALVGAVGGVGTTRTAVELAAIGAIDGRDVVVLDAAYATQGLSEYVSGRIAPDLTRLLVDETDRSLRETTYRIDGNWPGTLSVVPARAPFERLARAKAAEPARALASRIEEAARTADHVVIDTPPVASNPAVAAVTEAKRVAVLTPGSDHGRDALQRLRGRIEDVGTSLDLTIAAGEPIAPAEITLPDPAASTMRPVVDRDGGVYAAAVATAFETCFDTTVEVDFEEEGVLSRLR
ncbi:AAA family ATPase [Halopenitus sp. H-Gu1]|uniref:AAA family ATPase n=1 Tax=Halopenitus sp. H-Gu1 TaxID=3242697 RepID=UPI00359CF1C6